jgi:hypothetical protein
MILQLVGIHELLCNNCALEFKKFAPLNKLKRDESREPETTSNRRREPRFKVHFRVRLARVLKERFGEETLYGTEYSGYTRDISKIGLAIILPNVGAETSDFNNSRTVFCAWVDLPTGPVKLHIVPVRLEKPVPSSGKVPLLIGAHIRGISETDRIAFHGYVETLQE